MDAAVKQMIDSMQMGIDSMAGMVSDKDLVDRAYGVIDKMKAVGAEGHDMASFQQELQSRGIMNEYGEVMAKLGEAQAAGLEDMVAQSEQMAEESKPVDLESLDITDLEVVLKPHRMAYNQIKSSENKPYQKKSYEDLFALAENCSTIPEFNRRLLAEGHQQHLGFAATWESNLSSLQYEIAHEQPEMITWALNALELTRDHPAPETITYSLTELALTNEQARSRRQNIMLPFNAFLSALSDYLMWPHMHTEEQRQKILRLLDFSNKLTGWEMDEALYRPLVRRVQEIASEAVKDEFGPDWLRLVAFLRTGWHMDAKHTPEELKSMGGFTKMPKPDPLPYPYRTGPVGGVELLLSKPPFTLPFDEAYPVRLTLTNHAAEPRGLEKDRGLRLWIFDDEEAPQTLRTPVQLPDTLGPGESMTIEGDLYDWGLPKAEKLYMVAFDVGVVGEHTCDLAEKYSDFNKLTRPFMANYVLEPFQGGTATDPDFVMPRRPIPEYPFPRPLTGL